MENGTEKSEVARFRRQQALEKEAARLALSGLAITARHDFIVSRMQRGGERILQLIEEGKHEEAQVLMNSENWGIGDDAKTDVERKNNGQVQPEPSTHASAQLQ